MSEHLYFLRQFTRAAIDVGALIPTSRYAAAAMASEMARRDGPRRVLEVGPGTGAITAEIVRNLRDGDRLELYELHPPFVAFLERRLAEDPLFAARRPQITLHAGDIREIDRRARFDCIVSAIPFVNCPPDVVETIIELYRSILAPGGVLSFIEYAYLRALKRRLPSGARRAHADASAAVLERAVEPFVFRRDLVVRNLPPAWVRHVRFAAAKPEDALALRPLTRRERATFGPVSLAARGVPLVAALLGLAWRARRRAPRLSASAALAALGIAAFFRDPQRAVPTDPDAALAAADGRVLAVEPVRDTRFGDGEWLRIAVFLALTDVHVNRSPVAGRIDGHVDEVGGYANAAGPGAEHNQARYTIITSPHGRCVVAQRAGLVARRIVTWARPGELVAQGERIGLICFGSRTDVYVPADDYVAAVAPGDRVVAGITVLARRRSGDGPK